MVMAGTLYPANQLGRWNFGEDAQLSIPRGELIGSMRLLAVARQNDERP
jgi:hypothetical protein